MKDTNSASHCKAGGDDNARSEAARLAVFTGSDLNRELCDLQEAIMALGLAAERWLATPHLERYRADLEAAGLTPLPTYKETVDLNMVRESLTTIVAVAHLTYEVMGHIARPDYEVIDGGPAGAPITLVAADDS